MLKLKKDWRRSEVIVAAICAWAVLVALIFFWQVVSYWGLVEVAAEWQFNLFSRYFPAMIYLIFVMIFAFPVFLLVRGRWWEKEAHADGAEADERVLLEHGLINVTRFMKAMLYTSAGCLTAAAIALLSMFFLPTADGPPQRLDAAIIAPAPTREGASLLDGTIVYSQTAALNQDVWVTRQDLRVAPVVGNDQHGRTIRYFVELTGNELNRRTDQIIEQRRGILRRNALPGELYHLYRYAGFEMTDPYYVLYSSGRTLRWPHIQTAIQLFIAALCFGAIGGWQFLVRRRLVSREAALTRH